MTLKDGHRRRLRILEATPIVELSVGPDLEHLEAEPEILADPGEAVILTCSVPPESRHDIYARVSRPAMGIPEDAVTRSAHTALGPGAPLAIGRSLFVSPSASTETVL
ncbi:hypothetical protein BMF94_2760 [Rhodotorula taiwanensis]|uniref:Uncharacterized protein n=1 Tax=Rhodotorula taiwanensis TaxID=741276 RepID=A0A2S5BBM7_9BASI|nr:hypothetical protein BMF94_2760 [Rhodotorula taiwanensis]